MVGTHSWGLRDVQSWIRHCPLDGRHAGWHRRGLWRGRAVRSIMTGGGKWVDIKLTANSQHPLLTADIEDYQASEAAVIADYDAHSRRARAGAQASVPAVAHPPRNRR
jgi:hypothetical protein